MRTFKFKIDPRRQAQLQLLGDIHTQIGNALDEERKGSRRLNRKRIAHDLGWDKAALTRKLKPKSNVTIETLSDLAYALDREVLVFIVRPEQAMAVRCSVEFVCLSSS